jgi:ABC-type phosphate transport system substrate-binding protein
MKTFPKKLMFILAVGLSFASYAARGQNQLAIIVNKSCALDSATSGELQKYFKADKTKFPDGTKIIIVMQDVGRPGRDAALKLIYKMSESEYNDYFVGQTFTGAVASAPKALASPAAVKAFVAATPGAIGYVRASELDDSVKAMKIDGKSPADADYSLK